MSKQLRERDWVGPSVFIVIGLLLLLNNLGYISWSIWGQLVKYWPVLLIVGGLVLVFGGGSRGTGRYFGVLVFSAVILWAVSGYIGHGVDFRALGPGLGSPRQHYLTQTVGEENNAQSVDVSMIFQHAQVKLENTDHPLAAEMRSEITDGSGEPKFDRDWLNNELKIGFQQKRDWIDGGWFGARYNKYHVYLGKKGVPYRVKLEVGSGKAEIDLGAVLLQKGYFSVGSGKLEGEFSEETPISGGPLVLQVGSGAADFEGLGYLAPSNVEVAVGSGAASIGFDGMRIKDNCRLNISVGSGCTVIRLPRDIGWMLKATVGSGNLRVDGKPLGRGTIITSGQNGEAGSGLEIELNVGSGTVELVSE